MLEKSKSSGADDFIIIIRDKLLEEGNNNWDISRADGCLHAKHLPTIKKIENECGKGLITQIWIERLKGGYGRCKFEVTRYIPSMSESESVLIRKKIACSLRSFMALNGLPKEIEEATGSTVIAIKINWSKERTELHNKTEVSKVIDFYRFLDEKLNEWNSRDSINLLYNNHYQIINSLIDKSKISNSEQRNVVIFESGLVQSEPISKTYLTIDHLKPNITTKRITRPASLVWQGDLTLYATSLKVSDLLINNFYSIERLDPENANEKGYQRLLNKGRAKKLTDLNMGLAYSYIHQKVVYLTKF